MLEKSDLIIRLKAISTRIDLGFMGPEVCTIWRALFKENTKLLLLQNVEDKCPRKHVGRSPSHRALEGAMWGPCRHPTQCSQLCFGLLGSTCLRIEANRSGLLSMHLIKVVLCFEDQNHTSKSKLFLGRRSYLTFIL